MEKIYIISMIIMMVATALMIKQLYEHLELKENRELLVLVIGLFVDFAGCIATSSSREIAEIMVGYRVMLVGRTLFGEGFILYYARCFKAKFGNTILFIWIIDQLLCILGSFVYRIDNLYLTNISITKYNDISILTGDKQAIYYSHNIVVSLVGFWAIALVVKEYFKIRKQNDKVQKYILVYFILGVVLQGISLGVYELGRFNYPDYSSLLRGIMACIYSAMAVKYHFISYESLARDTLLNDIGAGFIVLSSRYRILYHNDIAREAFPELNTLEGISPYSEAVKEAIDLRETEVQRKGITYRITADRIYDKRKLAGYSLLIINVTDFLVLEKQASVSRDAKEKLLTNMAHELRTPINAISGEAEMMLGCNEPEKYKEYARNIQTSVDRLNDSFNYLLEAFNEETEVLSPTDNPYNVCVLLDTIISNCSRRANKKEIEFEAEIDPDLYFDAVGDDSSVYKLLINVMFNAIRYTESGRVSFYVTNTLRENGECDYEFIVADTGEHASDFISRDGETEVMTEMPEYDSKGLSFLLARRLLATLNGKIEIRSNAKRKNVFYIRIPQKISSANTIRSLNMQDKLKVILLGSSREYWRDLINIMEGLDMEYELIPITSRPSKSYDSKTPVVLTERPKDNKVKYNPEYFEDYFMAFAGNTVTVDEGKGEYVTVGKPFSVLTLRRIFSVMGMIRGIDSKNLSGDFIAPSARVLVVDDEYLNRKVAAQILEGFKVKVDAVASGYECIELLNEGRQYDIIFMDYMMEGLNGIDTTSQIRVMEEAGDVTIVAFTANDAPGAKEKYQAAGMNGVLFKPAGKDDFARILRKYLPAASIVEKLIDEDQKEESFDFEIEGLNPEVGLTYVSGNVESYKSILIEYANEIYGKSAKISEFYSQGDWYDFTVYVHGVKSASRMIGIEKLGDIMAGLEAAGKTEDRDYVEANLAQALELYESYVPLLSALDDTKEDTREHSSLHRLVSEIKSAAEDFEMEDVESLIKELESGSYGQVDKEDLDSINESIKAADYYELVDCIERLLEKIEAKENNS